MSFTTNSSNLSGKSTTNAFDIIANSLTVNKNTLCKGDLTVLGTTNIGNVSLENGFVNNLTVNNFTATNPVPITSGGTGLATIGSPNQVLTVNPAGTSLIYQAQGLINPATITGTGFTGNPTLSLGIEADTGSLGRGFIRTGLAATSGLLLGTVNATVLRLWSNFSTDSNAEIINTNANFTYNSTGTAGVFQVLNGGGGISFTNSGIGTISMGTAGGSITLADPTSLSGAVNISTAGGVFNLSTGAGSTNITTLAGNLSLTTGIGALSLTTGAGNISLTTVGAGIISIVTATAGAINIGTTVGLVNLYGSAVTIGAPVIYIGTGSAVPIPSILTFACGAVTGITGAWTITTLGFQLNAASISLNSTGTIALNNSTTVGGDLTAGKATFTGSQQLATSTSLHSFINTAIDPTFTTATLSPNITPNAGVFTAIGKAISTSNCTFLSFDNFAVSESRWSIYNSTTSIKQVNNGNITLQAPSTILSGNLITPQNIISGVQIINNGNVTLTVSSAETILIRGGSGSTITLPDARTLIIGYSYTINNNSSNPTIVNRHTSGSVGTISAGNCAVVTVFDISSANGQWDIHISGAQGATDWANPGTIGSITPNTGAFTDLTAGKTTLTGFANTATATSLYTFINTATEPTFTTSTLAPNMLTNAALFTAVGKAISSTNCTFLSFDNLTISESRWSIYNSTTSIKQVNNGKITITASNTEIAGAGGLHVTGGTVLVGTGATAFSGIELIGTTGNYIDFTQPGFDYKTRILSTNSTSSLQYIANNHQFDGISTVSTTGVLNVQNSSTVTSTVATFLTPNLATLGQTQIVFGKATSTSNAAKISYQINTALPDFTQTSWNFYDGIGASISLYRNGEISITGTPQLNGKTTIVGSTLLSSSGVLNVENTSSATSSIATFLAPNLATTSQTQIVIGKNTSSSNAVILSYQLNTVVPSLTVSDWKFYDGIGGSITLYKGNVVEISGETQISGNVSAINLLNGTRMWFANDVTSVTNNNWTPLNYLFVTREKGNQGITWIDQGTGFRNTSDRSLLLTCSFSCKRSSGTLGVTAIRFFINNTFSLGTQDVSGFDAVSISGTCYLEPLDTIACQIYQNGGTTVTYQDIVVNISATTFYNVAV